MEGVGGAMIYSNFDMLSSSSSQQLSEEEVGDRYHYPRDDVDLSFSSSAAMISAGGQNLSEEEMMYENDSYWQGNMSGNGTYYYDDYANMVHYPLGFKIAIVILYNSVFVTAVLGNALVCYVVFSSPRMRTVTNYLIANLAVGDLLMAIFCVPFSYIPVLLQYWPFGHFLCYVLPPAQAVGVLVSSYTLVALAADRYVAILYPLRPRFRRSQACWVIAVVWLIAVITASPIAIFTDHYLDNRTGNYYCEETGWKTMGVEELKLPYGLTLMILQYFFPLIVLIFTYSRIAMAVWGKKSLGEAEDSRDQRLAKTKRKMIKMMLTVVIVYTVSWLPINLYIVCSDIWGDKLLLENQQLASYIYPVVHWLAMAHSVWNPVIYCYMNSRFREGFKAAVSNVPCMWKLVRFWQLRSDMTDSRRSNRLTRTNTSCTTYTFGSGSLHNLHTHSHYHHNPGPPRKHSYLSGFVTGSSGGGRAIVSQYPKPNHAHHSTRSNSSSTHVPVMMTSSVVDDNHHNHGHIPQHRRSLVTEVSNTVKASSTMTSLAPPASISPPVSPQSSSATGSVANFPLATLASSVVAPAPPPKYHRNGNGNSQRSFDLNGMHVVKSGNMSEGEVIPIHNSPSYVSISGKEVVTSVAVSQGPFHSSKINSHSPQTPGVTESFM